MKRLSQRSVAARSRVRFPLVPHMQFNEYQKKSRKTAVYPKIGKNFTFPTLGLVGEAGEVAEKVKKILRDKNGRLTSDDRKEMQKELGDVLWYIANLSSELGLTLDAVAKMNVDKLASRLKRKKIHGSGDNR